MPRHRYKYSHEHLDFIKIRQNIALLISRYLIYFIGSIVLAIGYYILFSSFIYLPEERKLEKENQLLTQQYKLLNERFDQLEVVLNDISSRDNQIYRTIFQADPLPLTPSRIGGENRYEELESFDNADLATITNNRLYTLAERSKSQAALLDTITAKLERKNIDFLTIPAIQPIQNKDLSRTGASVGMRIHPFFKVLREHTGIDFVAATGVNVMATANGTVVSVIRSLQQHGNYVVIDHGNGYTTLYAHLNTIEVKQGQQVKRGQVIATVGNTGSSMAPHLHYEVLKEDKYKDPLSFFFMDISPAEHDRMIKLSTNSGQSLD